MPDTAQTISTPAEGFRETIESVVIALILAFVFRAFIVEAFVIPTGSMAPTLYGAHGTIICDDCGTEFAYGLRDPSSRRGNVEVVTSTKAYCPNCRYPNTNLETSDRRGNAESGDRILVLKWPFDLGLASLGPARWDVTVFKNPKDGSTNFIKRLAGLPGEVLMIVGGDVYAAPTSELSERTVAELDKLRHEKYELREAARRGVMDGRTLRAVPPFVLNELDKRARIVRKTSVAQKALWLGVYDQDLPPQRSGRERRRDEVSPFWTAIHGQASGWDTSSRRILFEDRGVADDVLELRGPAIRATCAYNIRGNAPKPVPPRSTQPPFVSDQHVRFVLTPGSSAGSIAVGLARQHRTFWATLYMDGRVTIEEGGRGAGTAGALSCATRLPPLRTGKPVQVSFENLDYRLAICVGGREVLASSDDPESPAYYGPNLRALRRMRTTTPSRPRIRAEGGEFELTHLAVDRDIYYYNPRSRNLVPWARVTEWGGPNSPILLRSHEYFMLGDNTAASADSRLWHRIGPHLIDRGEDCQLGTVLRDQLIGKAFFVYWPSMQRIKWLDWLPLLGRWGVVPDVGRMRWIR